MVGVICNKFNNHIKELLQKYGIGRHNRKSDRWMCYPNLQRIYIGEISSRTKYFWALHEIGHCVSINALKYYNKIWSINNSRPYRRITLPAPGIRQNHEYIVPMEAHAWEWALHHTKYKIDDKTISSIETESLGAYMKYYAYTTGCHPLVDAVHWKITKDYVKGHYRDL